MEMKRQKLNSYQWKNAVLQASFGVLALIFRVACYSQNRKFR